MKKMIICIAAGMTLAASALFGSCTESIPPYDPALRTPLDTGEEAVTVSSDSYEFYHNYIEVPFPVGGRKTYDVGDPFVMKHGGKYYLYCSTPDASYEATRTKIGCWTSENMVDWEWVGWAYEPPKGQTSAGSPTHIAFAPEVVFYKGWFYLCESQRGYGHYFLRSKTPEGPFTLISDNLGMGIDGTFYLADSGELYFVSANDTISPGKMTAFPIEFVEDGTGNADGVTVQLGKMEVISAANLGGWTEGPGLFRRGSYGYMTYTGNHVDSASYRVGYSYSSEKNTLQGLTARADNVVLASSGMDRSSPAGYNGDGSTVVTSFRGTGHSSNAVGPDLDGIFTAFHIANRVDHTNVRADGTGYRRYCLTQYFTNDSYLIANGLGNYDRPMPASPDYRGDVAALTGEAFKVSDKATEKVYSAEFSLQLIEGKGSVVVGYTDDNNYTEIAVDGAALKVTSVSGGKRREIGQAAVAQSTNAEAEHIIKVVNGSNGSNIYYDNMSVIRAEVLADGKVGFGTGTPRSVTFSNDAYGTSDFEAVKDLTGGWPAFTYMKGEDRGWHLSDGKVNEDGVRQGEKETTKEVSFQETTKDPKETAKKDAALVSARVTELSRGDWVKYTVNAPEAGSYSLSLVASKESAGCIFEVILDNGEITKMEVPSEEYFGENEYAKVYAGSFEVPAAGLHIMKIRVYGSKLGVVNFYTEQDAELHEMTDPLTSPAEDGMRKVLGTGTYSASGYFSNVNDDRTLLIAGNKGCSSFEFSADVKIVTTGTGGILFRMNEFSYTNSTTSKAGTMYTGYFLQLDPNYVKLSKVYYTKSEQLAIARTTDGNSLANGNVVNVAVETVNGKFTVYLNGEKALEAFDAFPFLTGYVGLYCENKAGMIFTNAVYGAPLV